MKALSVRTYRTLRKQLAVLKLSNVSRTVFRAVFVKRKSFYRAHFRRCWRLVILSVVTRFSGS